MKVPTITGFILKITQLNFAKAFFVVVERSIRAEGEEKKRKKRKKSNIITRIL
jgi:hypothetical protein